MYWISSPNKNRKKIHCLCVRFKNLWANNDLWLQQPQHYSSLGCVRAVLPLQCCTGEKSWTCKWGSRVAETVTVDWNCNNLTFLWESTQVYFCGLLLTLFGSRAMSLWTTEAADDGLIRLLGNPTTPLLVGHAPCTHPWPSITQLVMLCFQATGACHWCHARPPIGQSASNCSHLILWPVAFI